MKLINNIRSHILDEEFRIIVFNNKLNVINYIELIDFSDYEVKIKYVKGLLIIKGSDLVVKKILNDELLIEGSINNIELR